MNWADLRHADPNERNELSDPSQWQYGDELESIRNAAVNHARGIANLNDEHLGDAGSDSDGDSADNSSDIIIIARAAVRRRGPFLPDFHIMLHRGS